MRLNHIWLYSNDISIHAPPRGATGGAGRKSRHEKNFNSRPSARGDAASSGRRLCPLYFNSRPSARGDHGVNGASASQSISIHAPPRGATGEALQFLPEFVNFNSRPSARGDPSRSAASSEVIISIHAPPRGATVLQPPCALVVDISIHAPPRGATGQTNLVAIKKCLISIHAPPRGATSA